MHHALEIEEILFNLVQYLSPPYEPWDPDYIKATSSLAALARTCHAFKEPALSELWRSLKDLSPLARCLPEASYRLSSELDPIVFHTFMERYSFSRPLTQTEWDILRGYTRRIQFVHDFRNGLHWGSVAALLNPPTAEPLFPNLRWLGCDYTKDTMTWLNLPLPSLTGLSISLENPHWLEEPLTLFLNSSPNITKLSIYVNSLDGTFTKIGPNFISRWQNLHSVSCSQFTLDTDDLVHLSRMSALTLLEFALNATLQTFYSLLVFSKLLYFTLHCESLEPISRSLLQIRLPVLTSFRACIDSCPSRKDLAIFFAGVRTSNTGNTIEALQLNQSFRDMDDILRSELSLGFEDLQPCMAFRNLREIEIDIDYSVNLTDREVLTLASAWPKLECLLINQKSSWNTSGGITLDGLVELLRTCRLLKYVALRLDTRGYAEVPPNHTLASSEWTFPRGFAIDVVDSAIEAESVEAVTTFLCGLSDCLESRLGLYAWRYGGEVLYPANADEYMDRWEDIRRRVRSCWRSETAD